MGFFDWIIQFVNQAQGALNAVVIFMACVMVLVIWIKTKALAATLIGAFVAAVVIGLVAFGGMQWLAEMGRNTLGW